MLAMVHMVRNYMVQRLDIDTDCVATVVDGNNTVILFPHLQALNAKIFAFPPDINFVSDSS